MKRFACVACGQVFDGPAHFHGEAGPFCLTHVQESVRASKVSVALFPPAGSEQVSTTPPNRAETGLESKKHEKTAQDTPNAPKAKKKGFWGK